MNTTVPLISSGTAGPLGVLHLPRLWQKVSLEQRGALAAGYPGIGKGYDQMVLDALGLKNDAVVSFIKTNRPDIKPHREQTGKPTNRPRQLNVPENLLPAMTLEINQHRTAAATITRPAPPRNRQSKPRQQHIIDAAMKRRRHPRQQFTRDRSRQPEREMPGRAGNVATSIEPTRNQRNRRRAQKLAPER